MTVEEQTGLLRFENFLFSYGFGIVWILQEVGDLKQFIIMLKQRLNDCCSQTWHSGISNSTNCDFYKHLKSLLNVERYLELDMQPIYKRALARFRCSSHKLSIEYGRHFKVNREERICIFCLSEKYIAIVEDVFHVFFICEKYAEIRVRIHQPFFRTVFVLSSSFFYI